MMKTLKFIVLLSVMLVNVTPYIKDGKVEWKGNEAAAQNYVCESNWFQRLIGVYKCKKIGNEEDWFYGVNDSCKIANNQHICSNCHGLFAWTALEIPILCPDCQKEHPDIDPYPENGDNPDDGGSEPGSTTPPRR